MAPNEERLSNLIQSFPKLRNGITEYLQAKPDDSEAEGRLKNALEGLMVGLVAEPFMRSLRLLKYARIRLPIVEVRTKRHYELEAIKIDNNGEYSGKLVAGNMDSRRNIGNYSFSNFPKEPTDLNRILGVEPKVTTTQHGTIRMVWEPNNNTRIRYESHPKDEGIFNPRHHGEHYHIEVKPDNLTWNQAKRQGEIQKVKPENYKIGYGTGFLPGEKHPGN